jgi:hypothetical protein
MAVRIDVAEAAAFDGDMPAGLCDNEIEAAVVELARARARLDRGVAEPERPPSLSIATTDTRVRIAADLDGEGGEYAAKAIDVAVDRIGLPPDLPYPQRRALGLVAVCRHFLEHVDEPGQARTGGRPRVLAVADVETLRAEAGGSARLESGVVIPGEAVRRLACDAGISRVITKGRSEVLDVGRTTRAVSPPLARAVIVRDQHCTHPGCHAPPWACEIHHILHWALGGTTAHENLRLLCWFHHQQAHEHDPPSARRKAA